jgi:acetyltransferase-like isoleucine patch superfamily enzyme
MGDFFQHPQAICESDHIGANTRIWAYTHILEKAVIGKNCNICDHVFIENDVVIGNRVTIKSGVQIWDGISLEDDVFIGPNATFSNDKYPQSKRYSDEFLATIVKKGASIGAGAVILPGLRIGSMAIIGAGAVVTRSVPDNAIVIGNPARIHGYVAHENVGKVQTIDYKAELGQLNFTKNKLHLGIGSSAIYKLPNFRDLRGSLTAVEFPADLPFVPVRSFIVYHVPNEKVRGEHAHVNCEQLLIAAQGRLNVVIDNGKISREICLDSPEYGLYIPPMVWSVQYKFSNDSALLVFASQSYDKEDYIRDYQQFKANKT